MWTELKQELKQVFSQGLSQKHKTRLGVNSALLLLALALLLGSVWQWRIEPASPYQSGQFGQFDDFSSNAIVSVQPLYWNWYNKTGGSANVAAVTEVQMEELEESQINAVLMGVVISDTLSLATLIVEGNSEAVFHVGDELGAGAEIVEIEHDRVVIEENGRHTQINLKKYNDSVPSGTIANTQNFAGAQESFSLADLFSATPVSGENITSGLEIDSISEEMAMVADLQVGDVIIEIGNYPIEDVMSSPSLWMEFTAEAEVPLLLVRDGESIILNVDVFSLSAQIIPSLAGDLFP